MRYMPMRKDFFDMFDDPFFKQVRPMESIMRTDVFEKDGYYNLEIEIPGYKKEDIKLEISEGILTVTAEHNQNKEEKDEKGRPVRIERSFGYSQRSYDVGENIKAEDVKAKFENGILKLVFPSIEQKKIETSQTITIE